MPFYQLHKRYSELDPQQHYLLYCERGVMSQLQAQFLYTQRFQRIAVFKP
jgi:thiamine biosynthesis protein ThiI